ncbi:MAG: mobile mystery protein B [Verrucomicrobiae bacterium]|nr:mobile mystery protein B [Verrucomicrobiae bacterium]
MTFQYPEGATPLDLNEIDGLRLSHIATREELNRFEQENILEAIEWLGRRRSKSDVLDPAFLCELHRRMFHRVWKWAGKYRKTEKNLGVPAWQISVEMKNLCDDVRAWIEHKTYEADEIATRFHHRLVAIHPFSNGNGRWARLAADVLLEERFNSPRFTWGEAALEARGEPRTRYIEALQAADQHDFRPLLQFVRS